MVYSDGSDKSLGIPKPSSGSLLLSGEPVPDASPPPRNGGAALLQLGSTFQWGVLEGRGNAPSPKRLLLRSFCVHVPSARKRDGGPLLVEVVCLSKGKVPFVSILLAFWFNQYLIRDRIIR